MIKLVQVTDETLDHFSEMKIRLIKYHISYAAQLGLIDEVAINYDYQEAIKHYKKEDYDQYLLTEGHFIGILETQKKISSIHENQECLFIKNIYLDEPYRGNGYFKQVLDYLKEDNKNIELECYYDLPAHRVYQEQGFQRLKSHYFLSREKGV